MGTFISECHCLLLVTSFPQPKGRTFSLLGQTNTTRCPQPLSGGEVKTVTPGRTHDETRCSHARFPSAAFDSTFTAKGRSLVVDHVVQQHRFATMASLSDKNAEAWARATAGFRGPKGVLATRISSVPPQETALTALTLPPLPRGKRPETPLLAFTAKHSQPPTLSPTVPDPASSGPRPPVTVKISASASVGKEQDVGFRLFPGPRELTPDEVAMEQEKRRTRKAKARKEVALPHIEDRPGCLPFSELQEFAFDCLQFEVHTKMTLLTLRYRRWPVPVPGVEKIPKKQLTKAEEVDARRARPLPPCLGCAVAGVRCSAQWRGYKSTDDSVRCFRCLREGERYCILQSDDVTRRAPKTARFRPWTVALAPPAYEPRARSDGMTLLWSREHGDTVDADALRARAEELIGGAGYVGGHWAAGAADAPAPLPVWTPDNKTNQAPETDWQTHLLRQAEARRRKNGKTEVAVLRKMKEEREQRAVAAARDLQERRYRSLLSRFRVPMA